MGNSLNRYTERHPCSGRGLEISGALPAPQPPSNPWSQFGTTDAFVAHVLPRLSVLDRVRLGAVSREYRCAVYGEPNLPSVTSRATLPVESCEIGPTGTPVPPLVPAWAMQALATEVPHAHAGVGAEGGLTLAAATLAMARLATMTFRRGHGAFHGPWPSAWRQSRREVLEQSDLEKSLGVRPVDYRFFELLGHRYSAWKELQLGHLPAAEESWITASKLANDMDIGLEDFRARLADAYDAKAADAESHVAEVDLDKVAESFARGSPQFVAVVRMLSTQHGEGNVHRQKAGLLRATPTPVLVENKPRWYQRSLIPRWAPSLEQTGQAPLPTERQA